MLWKRCKLITKTGFVSNEKELLENNDGFNSFEQQRYLSYDICTAVNNFNLKSIRNASFTIPWFP